MTFRACDQCRTRRVKCEASEGSCQPCLKKDLICTFRDPIQKRGPKSTRNGNSASSRDISPKINSPNRAPYRMMNNRIMHNITAADNEYNRNQLYDTINNHEPNPYFVDGKLTKLGLEKQLIDHFMVSLNPVLGNPVNSRNLEMIRSSDPSPSETFLFFCICTCAAMYSDLGMNNNTTLYYYSHATALIQISDEQRDDTYFKGMVILDYLKKYLFNILFGKAPPKKINNH